MDDYEKRLERASKFLSRGLNVLPTSLCSLDTSKLMIAYFSVCGLNLMNKLDCMPIEREKLIDWIYYHQIEDHLSDIDYGLCGFRGSCSLINKKISDDNRQIHDYDCSHITMTFSALNSLLSLGDDLSRINRKSILKSLQALQLSDGSFTATYDRSENDVRFIYSACSICYVLNDWSRFNMDSACKFIKSCLTYEGAFGQNPESEAHGGSTFCAVASLYLMGRMNELSDREREELIAWCLNRQQTGFNGRVNKPIDCCYSSWIGCTLKMLDAFKFTNREKNIDYLFECYSNIVGGFAKWPCCSPDPLHTFMGLCALSLLDFANLKLIHPALLITMETHEHLKRLHREWKLHE